MKYFESHYTNNSKEHECNEIEIRSLKDIQAEIADSIVFTIDTISRIRAIDYHYIELMREVSIKLETLKVDETISTPDTTHCTLTYKRIALN